MNLLDPYQFRDLFRDARSLAVVGNAPTVKEWENGDRIDRHDVVARFNRIRTQGLEKNIGTRTDILFVNSANSLAQSPSPAQTSRPRCLVCFISPWGARGFDPEAFREWVGDLPILLSFGPDMIGLASLLRSRPLTSGTYALFTLTQLLAFQELFVTGFTMFGSVEGGTGKVYADNNPQMGSFHDLDQESALFAQLLDGFDGKLTVTSEVRSLLIKEGFRPPHDEEGNGSKPRSNSLRRQLAEALSWRLLKWGMGLRRIVESK